MITLIDDLDLSKTYSYADYLLWRIKERLELIRGKILQMSPAPSSKHQRITFVLSGNFYNAFKTKPCKVFVAPFDVRFSRKQDDSGKETFSVVQPDLCVICDISKIDRKGCKGAPDLVVEILSPGNSKREMTQKYELYEEYGVREYWLVNPKEEHVLIFTLQDGHFVGMKPAVKGGANLRSYIFPDLEIDLEEIFADIPFKDEPSEEEN